MAVLVASDFSNVCDENQVGNLAPSLRGLPTLKKVQIVYRLGDKFMSRVLIQSCLVSSGQYIVTAR